MTHPEKGRVPIVGIGASAGGIEALELLFRAMPRDIGAAFVVVTHLNPKHESLLPGIIRRYTDIPVETAIDAAEVAVGHIYVMPENVALTIHGGRLQVTSPRPTHRESHPIDLFLSALAMDQGEYAAAIILSGSDGDGTLGAKAIKGCGGLTMAQVADGSAPKYPGMPQTAIASGMIDFALPAQDMPERLLAFVKGLESIDSRDPEADGVLQNVETLREDIFGLLEGQLGHDFSGYKAQTFNRRIQRRVELLQLEGVEAYVALLRRDTSEVAALFRDLLINVTNFFRDTDAFDALKRHVVPKLFEGKGRDRTVRVWVPGCATGEEVYSIAILLREHMDELTTKPRVQVFATDIDERSLDVARFARYPEPLLAGVSPERRRRFFDTDGSSLVVSKDVRELCIFSPHSLIRDPPFSRMDLVSCRNLLIYLAPNMQGQVIPLFHYSLKPNGYLFLGTSENIGQFSELFSPVDKKQRIFRARDTAGAGMRVPLIARAQKDLLTQAVSGAKFSSMQALRQEVDARVIERFAPAHVVIDAEGDVILYSPRTGKYLEAAPGVPSRQLLAMARRGIRLEMRGAIRDAISERRRVERHDLAVEMDDGRLQMINLAIEPIDLRTDEPFYIVLFSDAGPPLDREQAIIRVVGDQGNAMSAMERELVETRERLQSVVEEYETALEELKSSNEELVSVNEELQSTNEELEASKEELQSVNEELQTVNAELGSKIDELDQSNGELRNLFDTSKMATIFVYRDLTIRNFTPLAAEIFNLVPADRGRSLTIFTSPLVYPEFVADITQTAQSGEPIETRVGHENGETRYLVRIQPYHSGSGHRDGATVTFLDITGLDGERSPGERNGRA